MAEDEREGEPEVEPEVRPESQPEEDAPPLASPGTLRRIKLVAAAYTLCGAAAFLATGQPLQAGVLTLSALASMVAFQGLERLVGRLQPRETGRIGWRDGALAMFRFVLLGGALAASLSLSSGELLGAIAGFSVLPLAVMTEGLWLAIASLAGKDRDGC